jgi:hypothetical protein
MSFEKDTDGTKFTRRGFLAGGAAVLAGATVPERVDAETQIQLPEFSDKEEFLDGIEREILNNASDYTPENDDQLYVKLESLLLGGMTYQEFLNITAIQSSNVSQEDYLNYDSIRATFIYSLHDYTSSVRGTIATRIAEMTDHPAYQISDPESLLNARNQVVSLYQKFTS